MRRLVLIITFALGTAIAGRAQASAHYCVPIKIWTDGTQYSYIEVVDGQTFAQPAFNTNIAVEVYDAGGTLLNSGYKPWTGNRLAGGQHVLVTTSALAPVLSITPDDSNLITLPLDGQFCLNDPVGGNGRWYCVGWGTITNKVQTDTTSPWGQFEEAITVGIRPCHPVARTNASIAAGGGGTWQGDAPPITLTNSSGGTGMFVNPACVPPDAGNSGADATTASDAATGADASGAADAAAGPDAASAIDSGSSSDSGTANAPDAASTADAGASSSSGCGCAAMDSSIVGMNATIVFGAAAVWWGSRRRRHADSRA